MAKKILKYPGPPLPIKNVPSLNVEVSFQRKQPGEGWGVLASFYNGLCGKTPPEKGIFFQASGISEREGISIVEVYETVGKSFYIFDL